jgi:transcriptional regulator with XRE-family HTH domain
MPGKLLFGPSPSLSRQLRELGERLRLARIRRRIPMAMLAERAGTTRVTLSKIEHGEPSVTLGAYANVLQALGLADDLALLARDDVLGRALQDARTGQRATRPRQPRASPTPPEAGR